MEIPYTSEVRADTGLSNSQLGIWLFLASETMLFGALFSSYVLLRSGAPAWPHGWGRLALPFGVLATALLAGSSVALLRARRKVREGEAGLGATRRALALTAWLACLFLLVEVIEYRRLLQTGEGPWQDTFAAIYFALTGVHGLHVLGGLLAIAWIATRRRGVTASRVETAATYWFFVDTVWLVLFVAFYLT